MKQHPIKSEKGHFVDTEGRWVDDLLAAIDRKDHMAFTEFLSPDASFRFGNGAPIRGRPEIAVAVSAFFLALKTLQHRVEDRWMLPDVAIVTGTVTYTRNDGSALQVPFANVLKFRLSGIHEYLVFVDNSALFVV